MNIQRPCSSAIRIPARVRSDRTSLSNCAKAASTPSISLPVDVSSIGSVTERREIPSDFNRARNAKWSYFSRANRVRLYTMTKYLALVGAAKVQQLLQFGAVRGLRALAFLPEPFDDFVSLAPAVLLAGA